MAKRLILTDGGISLVEEGGPAASVLSFFYDEPNHRVISSFNDMNEDAIIIAEQSLSGRNAYQVMGVQKGPNVMNVRGRLNAPALAEVSDNHVILDGGDTNVTYDVTPLEALGDGAQVVVSATDLSNSIEVISTSASFISPGGGVNPTFGFTQDGETRTFRFDGVMWWVW